MLDLKFVRENIDLVQQNLDNRHTKGDLKTFVSAYDERRQLIGQVRIKSASQFCNRRN